MISITEYLDTWDRLQSLVADRMIESVHLDFKALGYADARKSAEKKQADKQELRADVTAFANSGGGTILIGVAEDPDRGHATKVCGIDEPRVQEDFIREVLSRSIKPPLSGSAITVRTVHQPDALDRGVVAIAVRQAEAGLPHAVEDKGNDSVEFWIRTDKSKRRMDYLEIRAAFRAGEEEAEQQRLDTAALLDITKIKHSIRKAQGDFERIRSLLESLQPFSDSYEFGSRVGAAVVEAAGEVIEDARGGLPPDVARAAVEIIVEALPRPDDRAALDAFDPAADLAFTLVYDGMKYLENLAIVGVGADLFCSLLRKLRRRDHPAVREKVMEHLNRAKETAQQFEAREALLLLDFYEREGREHPRNGPALPAGLEWVIWGDDKPPGTAPRKA